MADSPPRPSDGHPQLASAVVIPEVLPQSASPPPNEQSPTNGHTTNPAPKRRASDLSQNDTEPDARHESQDPSTKRARLSSDLPNGSPLTDRSDSNTQGTRPRPTRPAAAATAEAERKRGKRLFGSLLGTLSQSSSVGAAQKRRADAERKQRDKLAVLSSSASAPQQSPTGNGAAESEDAPGARRRTAEELAVLQRERREQQRRWEEDEMRVRHASMRARARFLCTKAEPRICWLPYELLEEEEKTLDAQRERVEKDIAKEEENERRKGLDEEQTDDQRLEDPEQLLVERSGEDATSEPNTNEHNAATTDEANGDASHGLGQGGSGENADHGRTTIADNNADEHKDHGEDDEDIPLSRDAEEDPVLY